MKVCYCFLGTYRPLIWVYGFCKFGWITFSCHNVCNPDQDKFMYNVKEIPYQTAQKEITVLSIDISTKTDFGCDLFQTCAKCSFFRQMDATKNMFGFFNFFGTSGIYQTNPENPDDTSSQIANNYKFTEDAKRNPYSSPVLPCETKYDPDAEADQYGYMIDPESECTCSSCQNTCQPIDFNSIIRKNRVIDGFQTKTLYLAAFLIVLVVFSRLWSWYRKKQKKDKRASLDSYDRIKNIIDKNDQNND